LLDKHREWAYAPQLSREKERFLGGSSEKKTAEAGKNDANKFVERFRK
jgi:hypothetical protein